MSFVKTGSLSVDWLVMEVDLGLGQTRSGPGLRLWWTRTGAKGDKATSSARKKQRSYTINAQATNCVLNSLVIATWY